MSTRNFSRVNANTGKQDVSIIEVRGNRAQSVYYKGGDISVDWMLSEMHTVWWDIVDKNGLVVELLWRKHLTPGTKWHLTLCGTPCISLRAAGVGRTYHDYDGGESATCPECRAELEKVRQIYNLARSHESKAAHKLANEKANA